MEHTKGKLEAWGDDILVSIRTHVKGKGMVTICNMALDPIKEGSAEVFDAVDEQNVRALRIVHCWNNFDSVELERDALRDALEEIDTGQMKLLADWLDLKEAKAANAGIEVQLDLRRWAGIIEQALAGVKI